MVLAIPGPQAILLSTSRHSMDPFSQLDLAHPDHVSVITKDGRVTISVTKDGTSVTLGLPIRSGFNTNLMPALQQSNDMALMTKTITGSNTKKTQLPSKVTSETTRLIVGATTNRKKPAAFFNAKLTEGDVREIKGILSTPSLMKEFRSLNRAYIEIGKAYGVSQHTISNIHKGKAWAHVKA